jgi:hypothetical protein
LGGFTWNRPLGYAALIVEMTLTWSPIIEAGGAEEAQAESLRHSPKPHAAASGATGCTCGLREGRSGFLGSGNILAAAMDWNQGPAVLKDCSAPPAPMPVVQDGGPVARHQPLVLTLVLG